MAVAADNKLTPEDQARLAARLASHQAQHANDERKLPEPPLPWKFLSPLVWAPIFPFVRFTTKSWPQRHRNILLGVAIGIANLHGFWLINNPDLSDEALGD